MAVSSKPKPTTEERALAIHGWLLALTVTRCVIAKVVR